jgi:hypothetical protein
MCYGFLPRLPIPLLAGRLSRYNKVLRNILIGVVMALMLVSCLPSHTSYVYVLVPVYIGHPVLQQKEIIATKSATVPKNTEERDPWYCYSWMSDPGFEAETPYNWSDDPFYAKEGQTDTTPNYRLNSGLDAPVLANWKIESGF